MTVNNRADSLLSTFLSFVPLLCASMVVGIHSYGAGELPVWTVTSRVAGFFAHGLFMTAVPIFMMISGYLFYRNVRDMRQILDKQKRRCASILVPYLSWTVFYYIVYAMADRWGMLNNAVEFNLNGLLKAVMCYQYVFPFWFMSQLIIYIILAPVIFLTLKRKATSMVVLAIMTLLGLLGWKWNENLSGLDRMVFAPNFFCYYYLGAYLAGHAESLARGLQKLMRIPVWLGVIGLIGSCMLESYIFDTHAVFNDRLVVPVIVLLSLSLLFHAAARWGGRTVAAISSPQDSDDGSLRHPSDRGFDCCNANWSEHKPSSDVCPFSWNIYHILHMCDDRFKNPRAQLSV